MTLWRAIAEALAAARDAIEKGAPFALDIAIEKHDYPPHFARHHEAAFSG